MAKAPPQPSAINFPGIDGQVTAFLAHLENAIRAFQRDVDEVNIGYTAALLDSIPEIGNTLTRRPSFNADGLKVDSDLPFQVEIWPHEQSGEGRGYQVAFWVKSSGEAYMKVVDLFDRQSVRNMDWERVSRYDSL